MARKFCEYCSSYCDSELNKCPNCSASLTHDIIPDQDNLKETIMSAVNTGIRKATDAMNATRETQVQRVEPVQNNRRMCSKAITLLLLFVSGFVGGHKFYEGKPAMGVLYLFTMGFFFVGLVLDFFSIIFKPSLYPAKDY